MPLARFAQPSCEDQPAPNSTLGVLSSAVLPRMKKACARSSRPRPTRGRLHPEFIVMPQRQVARLDIAAGTLLFAGLLMALSVLSHEPTMAWGPRSGARESVPANLLGPAGLWLAQTLYETLGVAVYVLLASWFTLVVFLFLRRSLLTW